jgi:DNA-binding CsgD family transcriptional regulator/PAS domain-containing protein
MHWPLHGICGMLEQIAAMHGEPVRGACPDMMARRIDELLLDLYACPMEHGRWSGVLDQVCQAMNARSAVIQLLTRDEDRTWSRWMVRDSASEADRQAHDRYMGDAVNPRMQPSRQQRLSSPKPVLRDRDLFAPDDPTFIELQERLAAIRLGVFMSVNTPLPGGERLALVLHRDVDDPRDFQHHEETFALRLVPHLRQSVQLATQFNVAHERMRDLKEAIDHVRCALVLCGPDGRVCWANRSAEHIFARRTRLFVSSERLAAVTPAETALLRRTIAGLSQGKRAACSDRGEILVLGKNSSETLHVLLQPITDSRREQRVLLLISEPDAAPALPAEIIAQVFELSPAESRLTAALCSGLTVNDYAAAHGVSIGTARFQLKQVLAKTQVSRQSELVRQVCSSVITQALPRSN